MKSTFFVLFIVMYSSAVAAERFTMFTWLPGYHELGAIDRSRMSTNLKDWQVAIHKGEFRKVTESARIEQGSVALSDLALLLDMLPEEAQIAWHVGWWEDSDGYAAPSDYMLPSNEQKQWVQETVRNAGFPITLNEGDI